MLPRFLARRAVLEDRAAVPIDGPDRSLRLAPLHGSVELNLLVGEAEAKDGVRHVPDSGMWNA